MITVHVPRSRLAPNTKSHFTRDECLDKCRHFLTKLSRATRLNNASKIQHAQEMYDVWMERFKAGGYQIIPVDEPVMVDWEARYKILRKAVMGMMEVKDDVGELTQYRETLVKLGGPAWSVELVDELLKGEGA